MRTASSSSSRKSEFQSLNDDSGFFYRLGSGRNLRQRCYNVAHFWRIKSWSTAVIMAFNWKLSAILYFLAYAHCFFLKLQKKIDIFKASMTILGFFTGSGAGEISGSDVTTSLTSVQEGLFARSERRCNIAAGDFSRSRAGKKTQNRHCRFSFYHWL
jgi:hypothetical protein